MDDVLARLLDAHVKHSLAEWQGTRLPSTLERVVNGLFRWFAETKVDDVITPARVEEIIARYVIDLRVSGGVTELAGDMSRLVFASRATEETRLDQILNPASYEEFADKVLALEGVRRALIAWISESATVHTISAHLLARGLLDLAARAVPMPLLAAVWPASLRAELARRVLPGIERIAARGLERDPGRVMERARARLLELLDSEHLRAVVDDLWDRVSPMRLAEVFSFIRDQDVEDFVVLGYEFWLHYRKSEFFRRISSEVVAYFFQKYGQGSILAFVEDMGVDEAMVAREAVDVFGPWIEQATRTGALEQAIRAHLSDFYTSPAAHDVVHAQ